MKKRLHAVEDAAASVCLAVMVLLPLAEIVARAVLGRGIPGQAPIIQHLTLWVCFLGAALAAREGKLLSLATGTFLPEGRLRQGAAVFSSAVAAAVASLLCKASVDFVLLERSTGMNVTAFLPSWWTQLVMPLAFGAVGVRIVWKAGRGWGARALAAIGIPVGIVLGFFPQLVEGRPTWPGLLLLAAATLLGGPIFALLGGLAALLFMGDGVPPVAVPVEAYRLAASPTLPAIPLFTLVGFLLAEGRTSERLLRVFHAWFGWMPGGTAIVCAALCAFFTVFTGGSGVTILALGGLLLPALVKDLYPERFSLGLLTSSGSLGLLLPPALPLILYAIVANIPVDRIFLGGVLPGILLVSVVGAWGAWQGLASRVPRPRFERAEALAALWKAKWELLLPVLPLVAFFGGYATLVEASAITVLYALIVQRFVHHDVSWRKNLLPVFRQCVVLIGGVLLILCVAMGFSSYLVDAMIPAAALDWVQSHIGSRIAFLLCLNLFLLVVGCLMDIFSATVVVVPLIVPIGAAFGIDPVHLGIIFVANLELGYLTPPVGLNLFLSSYRFERPMLEIYRSTVPFFLILAAGVLVITYMPWLTTGLVDIFFR